jgi:hypothetical protein
MKKVVKILAPRTEISVDEAEYYLVTSDKGFIVGICDTGVKYFLLHTGNEGWNLFDLKTKSRYSYAKEFFTDLFREHSKVFVFYAFTEFKDAIEFYLKEE